MNLKPLGDRVIVEVLEEEQTTASGIVLPDTAKEKPQRGRVLAVGTGRYEDGKLDPARRRGRTTRSSSPSTAAPRSRSRARTT